MEVKMTIEGVENAIAKEPRAKEKSWYSPMNIVA